MYRSRSISFSCCLPKSGSTSVRARTWKARSQAAYQGYSHLSGIEMTSPLYMWCQCSLRGAAFRDRLERVGAPLLEPLVHVVVVELLGPEHPRQGLPHHVGRVGVQRRRDDGGVELVRLGPPRPEDLVEVPAEGPRGVSVALGRSRRGDVGETQPDRPALAGADRQAIMGGRLGPGLLRVHRPSWPWTTKSLMLSLTYGVRFGTPKIRCVFVSFSVKSKGTSPSQ